MKVRIGCDYRPVRFTHRTPTEYRALRPAIDADAARVQSALLSTESERNPDQIVGVALALVAALLVILTTIGVIE